MTEVDLDDLFVSLDFLLKVDALLGLHFDLQVLRLVFDEHAQVVFQ